jgi:hypothetical protein
VVALGVVVVVVGVLLVSWTVVDAAPTTLPAANPQRPALIVEPSVTRPDPSITWDPALRRYLLIGTQGLEATLPLWTSRSVEGPWTFAGNILKAPPSWASTEFRLWSPAMADINGVWTIWEAAGLAHGPQFCLFRATASEATGPYVADPGPPTWCFDLKTGGSIDPQPVEDGSGQWWLLFKQDRNQLSLPTTIDSVRLGVDGLPTGPMHVLLTADQPWQHGLIEAPGMIQDPVTKRWWVTFSAGKFSGGDRSDVYQPGESTNYQIVAAPCRGPGGPCTMSDLVHLVSSNQQGTGPGEQSVFVDADGVTWMAYNPIAPFLAPAHRPMALVRIGFTSRGVPYAARP